MLSSTSTKREAKSYLSRFQPFKLPSNQVPVIDPERSVQRFLEHSTKDRQGVNLGGFHKQIEAVDESPIFAQGSLPKGITDSGVESLHAALVKIRKPQGLDDETLKGIGLTLSQLGQLGLHSVVVVDCEDYKEESQRRYSQAWRRFVLEQTDRVVSGIDIHQGPGARRVDGIIGVASRIHHVNASNIKDEATRVVSRKGLMYPLRRGIIPVFAPIGYSEDAQKVVPITSEGLMLALTKELAGISLAAFLSEDPQDTLKRVQDLQRQTSLDRIILVDPLGGIPSNDTNHGGHIFINIEQEFHDIENELRNNKQSEDLDARNAYSFQSGTSRLLEYQEVTNHTAGRTLGSDQSHSPGKVHKELASSNSQHFSNLQLLQRTLSLLPPSSSAILTTPEEAANLRRSASMTLPASGVGTRRPRNALIHNLLTDKPPFSSSLPTGRLGISSRSDTPDEINTRPIIPVTFVKRGMPLTIIPDPRKNAWNPPDPGQTKITLHDPRIDLSRLVDLIEDSFNRKLDLNHYLARVNDRIAGVIIAGEYEGGALLTWEMPPDLSGAGEEASRHRLVPYLDKFAVRKRSQGAGGVADIVFTAMVRACFPDGVCWRSRKDNPVNKWYFERARGSWKIPEMNWTMFWTKENLGMDSQLFADYAAVCRAVEPSWADNKSVVD